MPTVLHACQNDRQRNWGKNSDYGEEIAICNPAKTSVVLSYFLKDQPFFRRYCFDIEPRGDVERR